MNMIKLEDFSHKIRVARNVVVMTGAGNLVEAQATAEGRTFSAEELIKLVDLARPAIQHLVEVQKSILNPVTSDK